MLSIILILSCVYRIVAQESRTNFIWGVNGHPLTQPDYRYATLKDQIRFLKDLGVNYYRIDVPINLAGQARNDAYLRELISQLKAIDVKPMLVLFPTGRKGGAKDSASIYKQYFELGKKIIDRYGNDVDVVEVGNEWDLKLMKKNAMNDGTKASHYQTDLIGKQMWLLAGIVDGMKKVKPSLKVSMSLTWVHWYYLDILQRYKINYDIIGYHWYSNMGNITNAIKPYGNFLPKIMEKYKKQLWITEFNTYKGTMKTPFLAQNKYVEESLKDIYHQKVVTGFFIYELFDQPSLTNYPAEMNYGMLFLKNAIYQKKPIYNTFREFIKLHK